MTGRIGQVVERAVVVQRPKVGFATKDVDFALQNRRHKARSLDCNVESFGEFGMRHLSVATGGSGNRSQIVGFRFGLV